MAGSNLQNTDASLVVAVAQAQNHAALGRVVDDFLERMAQARETRAREDARQREQEERLRRAEEFERQEQESARLLAERNRFVAEQVARADSQAAARSLVVAGRVDTTG